MPQHLPHHPLAHLDPPLRLCLCLCLRSFRCIVQLLPGQLLRLLRPLLRHHVHVLQPALHSPLDARRTPLDHALCNLISPSNDGLHRPGKAVERPRKLPVLHPPQHPPHRLPVLLGSRHAVHKLVPRHRQLMPQHLLHDPLAHLDPPLRLCLCLCLLSSRCIV